MSGSVNHLSSQRFTFDHITVIQITCHRRHDGIEFDSQKITLHGDVFIKKKIIFVQTNFTPTSGMRGPCGTDVIKVGMRVNKIFHPTTRLIEMIDDAVGIVARINNYRFTGFGIGQNGTVALKCTHGKSLDDHEYPFYVRCMKIYTKTGDDGTTSLFDGTRVSKDNERVQVYGDLDELNATIGLAASFLSTEFAGLQEDLFDVQRDLFALGAKMANPTEKKQKEKSDFAEDRITRLEHLIDKMEATLKPMASFILPGGTSAAAGLHLARTVCRRAERALVAFHHHTPVAEIYLHYMNRLSDYLFVAARYANKVAETEDIPW